MGSGIGTMGGRGGLRCPLLNMVRGQGWGGIWGMGCRFITMVWGQGWGQGWGWGGLRCPLTPLPPPITPQFSCSRVPLRDCAARALNVSPTAVGPCELRALNISLGAPPGLCRPQGGGCDFPEVSGDGGGPKSGVAVGVGEQRG